MCTPNLKKRAQRSCEDEEAVPLFRYRREAVSRLENTYTFPTLERSPDPLAANLGAR